MMIIMIMMMVVVVVAMVMAMWWRCWWWCCDNYHYYYYYYYVMIIIISLFLLYYIVWNYHTDSNADRVTLKTLNHQMSSTQHVAARAAGGGNGWQRLRESQRLLGLCLSAGAVALFFIYLLVGLHSGRCVYLACMYSSA
jgi:hypothetical protein